MPDGRYGIAHLLPAHAERSLLSYGLAETIAFKAVTLNPAKLLGLSERLASLTVGKDADLAVFDGQPLSNFSRCLMTVIDGEIYDHDGSSLLKIQ